MVNNKEYFTAINFDRRDTTKIPPPSDKVMYSLSRNGWSVRDIPADCIVPKGKIVLMHNSFNNLAYEFAKTGQFVDQKRLSISGTTAKGEEDIDMDMPGAYMDMPGEGFSTDGIIIPEETPETTPETAEETPETPEETVEETPTTPEKTPLSHTKYHDKFITLTKGLDKKTVKKMYYTLKYAN